MKVFVLHFGFAYEGAISNETRVFGTKEAAEELATKVMAEEPAFDWYDISEREVE